MLKIPRRHSHFVFGAIQSGLTSAVAAAIASVDYLSAGLFFRHWLLSWLVAWAVMLPVVLLAAPLIRKLVLLMTKEDRAD